jgi:uncharacterized 2Fe-2S/4Fe-4S cluster protein (DUF4445 family)
MSKVSFKNENIELFVEDGTSVLEAARLAGVAIETPCNATGLCGKCRVRLSVPKQMETVVSRDSPLRGADRGDVLACQFIVHGDIDVLIEDKNDENRTLRILSEGESFSYEIRPFVTKRFNGKHTNIYAGERKIGEEDGDTAGYIYGLVVDIGTTTLVASLIDLNSGEEVATESILNPQSAYAQDVLARINFASRSNGLDVMHKSFVDALVSMLGTISGIASMKPEHIYEVVFSGNPTMLHLACGIDPSPLGRYPYISHLEGGEHLPAKDLPISPFGLIYLPPIISAFVGADITSGVLASRLDSVSGTTLFIDVGTNGEIVLARDGVMSSTSTAAGPAFEGMNIACGMRAASGAIDSFGIDENGHISYRVIGGGEATGICGSGLLDIVGELTRHGVVGKNGRFASAVDNEPKKRAIRSLNGKPAFFITDDVYLTQHDIRQVQLAKGAIRAGIEALLSRLGVSAHAVNRVLIAGSFGYHLNERSLLDIGLLPSDFAGRVRFIGNTSKSGGTAFLLNRDFREQMKDIAGQIDNVELANEPDFEKLFVSSLRF